MHADIDYLRLTVAREPDHWVLAVLNRANGARIYESRSTNLDCAQYVLLDFISSELGRRIGEQDVTWVASPAPAATGASIEGWQTANPRNNPLLEAHQGCSRWRYDCRRAITAQNATAPTG